MVGAVVTWLGTNLVVNLRASGLPSGYGFLRQTAGFDIAGSDFDAAGTVWEAMVVGARNTVRVSAAAIVLATVVGLGVGIARLSPNRLLRRIGTMYVETFRNVPVLVTIVFVYQAVALQLPPIEDAPAPLGLAVVSNRGVWVPWPEPARSGVLWGSAALAVVAAAVAARVVERRRLRPGTTAPPGRAAWPAGAFAAVLVAGWLAAGTTVSVPAATGRSVEGGHRFEVEFAALLAGLVLYTSSHIAEIVRASILAVPRGQTEAAEALGLSPAQRLRLVVVPQALRVMVPPLANQYLNATKNSSLGVAVAYAELTLVTKVATAGANPAPQAISVLMLIYLCLSLVIAAVTNVLNRRLLAPWR